VFVAPEKTDQIATGAVLDDSYINGTRDRVQFKNFRKLQNPLRANTDGRTRNGQPLSRNFIRPYVICRTPMFIAIYMKSLSSAALGVADHKRL